LFIKKTIKIGSLGTETAFKHKYTINITIYQSTTILESGDKKNELINWPVEQSNVK